MTFKIKDPSKTERGKKNWHNYNIEVLNDEIVTQTIEIKRRYYLVGLAVYGLLLAITGVISVTAGDAFGSWTWGGAVIATIVVHIVASVRSVAENQIGGILFYGAPVMELKPGLVFVPLGIFQFVVLPSAPFQVQFPEDPEKVFKGSDAEYFEKGEDARKLLRLPIRITTGSPRENTKDERSILDTQMTLEVTFFVRFRVENFWVFLIRVGSFAEATRQLRDSGESALTEQISSRTPHLVIEELATMINGALLAKINTITEDWAIEVVEAAMLSPDLTKELSAQLRQTAVAKAVTAQRIIAAGATEVEIARTGAGDASAKLAMLKALAEGANALGITPEELIALQKAEALSQGNATVFLDGANGASIFGIGAKLAAGAQVVAPKTDPNT